MALTICYHTKLTGTAIILVIIVKKKKKGGGEGGVEDMIVPIVVELEELLSLV